MPAMGPRTAGRREAPSICRPAGPKIAGGADPFRPEDQKKKGSRGVCPMGNGMTDPFAVERFKELFLPKGWTVL